MVSGKKHRFGKPKQLIFKAGSSGCFGSGVITSDRAKMGSVPFS